MVNVGTLSSSPFSCEAIVRAGRYRDGGDVAVRLPLLSAYLGQAKPASTYWYLQAASDLLAAAAARLDQPSASANMSALAPTIEAFFTQRLTVQSDASPATIAAYRDALRLLLVFACDHIGKTPPTSTSLTSTLRSSARSSPT